MIKKKVYFTIAQIYG